MASSTSITVFKSSLICPVKPCPWCVLELPHNADWKQVMEAYTLLANRFKETAVNPYGYYLAIVAFAQLQDIFRQRGVPDHALCGPTVLDVHELTTRLPALTACQMAWAAAGAPPPPPLDSQSGPAYVAPPHTISEPPGLHHRWAVAARGSADEPRRHDDPWWKIGQRSMPVFRWWVLGGKKHNNWQLMDRDLNDHLEHEWVRGRSTKWSWRDDDGHENIWVFDFRTMTQTNTTTKAERRISRWEESDESD